MEFIQRIVFRADEAIELLHFLNENHIKYETPSKDAIPLVILEISESHKCWPEISKYLQEYHITPLTSVLYTEEELNNAKWFKLRSMWLNGYPQPEDYFRYKHITYNKDKHCEKCGSGLIQVDKFRMRKAPNWKNKHFFSLYWIENEEFFVDNKAKDILQALNIKDIEFENVTNKKGDVIFDNVYQIKINKILSKGLIELPDTIKLIRYCDDCKSIKFIMRGRGMIYDKSVFDDQYDIVKSFELFGDGHHASRMVFVSQKFYRAIKGNGLDKNLIFEPLTLI